MDNYTKWVEKEQAWIEEIDRKTKAMIIKYFVLAFLGIEVALGALGLLAAGGIDIQGMLQNLLYGLIFGVLMMIFALCMMVRKPSKPYMKRLKEGTEALTPADREEMASQMLSSDVISVNYKAVDKTEERILLSQNYLLNSSAKGEFVLVNLKQLDRIETDLRDTSYIVRTNGTRVTVNDAVYVILFYYKKISDGKKQAADAVCVFPDRNTRDQVVQYIQERTAEEY